MLFFLSLLFISIDCQGIRIPLDIEPELPQKRRYTMMYSLEAIVFGTSLLGVWDTPFQLDFYASKGVFSLSNCKINAYL